MSDGRVIPGIYFNRYITVVMSIMPLAKSKLTSQGQISVPVEVREKLGVGPGSILEWEEQGDQLVVRRAGRFTSEEIHEALFPKGTGVRATDVKAGIRKHIRKKHARS